MSAPRVVAWDTCVLIAWLMDEFRPDHEMDGVAQSVQRIQKGEDHLLLARTVLDEIERSRYPGETMNMLNAFLRRRTVTIQAPTPPIYHLADRLQAFYNRKVGPPLMLADALIVATAINCNASVFYTFDNGRRGGLSLLGQNGNVGGHRLVIQKPPVGQPSLFSGV